MRHFVTFVRTALLAILLIGQPAASQSQAADIRGVITQQLQAFQADDFERAFTFASPMIQGIFQNPERFGQMVRNGYPMVWRPSDIKFGTIRDQAGTRVQIVYLTDQAGRLFEAQYEMIPTDTGWEINGVAIKPADLGA